MMVRSNAQLKQTIRNHLRQAFAMDCDDDSALDYACRMVGEQHRALAGQVLARDFKTYDLI